MNCGKIINKIFTVAAISVTLATPSFAQTSDDSLKQAERMKQQIERSKTNENHQLLASLNGEWSFIGRHIPGDTTQKPIETFGTITRKGIWENRYFITETSSGKKIPMPWANGKEMTYHDMYIEGYDNVKQKFFFTTVGNHWSTGYFTCEGSYNLTTKTLSYEGEFEPAPGIKMKILCLLKFINPDHFSIEWHRSIDERNVARSEANYTRLKKDK
ncbi:MAG: DUF1579 family protein [Chitinophagaceae bacterium]|nr:DUF1579 family protein [Chitinophagaceae bacterium]